MTGHQSDANFASGLLSVLNSGQCLAVGATNHFRPIANLEFPFGRICGDVGCIFQTNGNNKLLIVEREGSAPGNERNILKWHHAISSKSPILLSDGITSLPCDSGLPILLVLAFGRTAKWAISDYQKTFAFCKLLADVVNREHSQDILRVLVLKSDHETTDWRVHGEQAGRAIIDSLPNANDIQED